MCRKGGQIRREIRLAEKNKMLKRKDIRDTEEEILRFLSL